MFAPENTNLKPGRVGQSITLSFYIYSYPEIKEIIIENIKQITIKSKEIKLYRILNYTLVYSQYNNIVGIEGYEILIESKILGIDDFQLYRITAKNHLGDGYYNFAIIDNGKCSNNNLDNKVYAPEAHSDNKCLISNSRLK